MTNTHEQAITTLQHLLDICADGVEGYKRAAQAITTPRVHRALELNALEREEVTAALTEVLVELGHPPPSHGTLGGAVHRGWLRALGAVHKDEAILHECLRGERITVDAFAQALAHELPANVRTVIQSQLSRILSALERVDTAERPDHPQEVPS